MGNGGKIFYCENACRICCYYFSTSTLATSFRRALTVFAFDAHVTTTVAVKSIFVLMLFIGFGDGKSLSSLMPLRTCS